MQLGSNLADFLVEHPVDHGVHIFVGGQGLSSRQKLLTDRVKAALDLLAFLKGKDASSPKSDRPGLR
jgi:hypothetical protein